MNKTAPCVLATGQLWKLDTFYIRISSMGKTLTTYKRMRSVGQKGVQTSIDRIARLEKYLKAQRATLVDAN